MGDYANGGGIFSQGDLTLTSSTVANNHAYSPTSVGGGIWDNATLLEITSSIVADNTAGGSPDIQPGAGILLVDYSLIGDTAGSGINAGTGTDNILDQPAGLLPLANNGGPTETHALLVTSLAINAGDPGFLPPPNFDQRGAPFTRVVGGRIDMGAYEQQTAAGQNWTVDILLDEDDGDYTAGDLSLREAVGLANSNIAADTITFDPIVFATSQTISLVLGEMTITDPLTINGPGQQLLTIDAQQNSRIFNITATTGDFTIAGLALTGGRTTGNNTSPNFDGPFSGGAIRSLTTDSLTIDQSTVSGNSTAGFFAAGGGISSVGDITLTSSTVSGNSTAGNGALGGGVFSFDSITLTNSTVSGNIADNGGGIYSFDAVTLTSSTVSGNISTGNGGGIFSSGNVTLTSSTVSGNRSARSGGGIRSSGDVTLTSSTVSGNISDNGTANGNGGGIDAQGAVTLTNSTISGNSVVGNAVFGGGIFSSGDVTLTSSTVTDNRALGIAISIGGGIFKSAGPSINITNSIVAGNTTTVASSDIGGGAGTFSVNYSLIGDNAGTALVEAQTADANGNLIGSAAGAGVIDPLLHPLANNGGPTLTHALLASSPAINAGTSSTEPFDQRGPGAPGFLRDNGNGVDIGAFELQVVVDSADFDRDGDIDGRDFLFWQRGFGTPNANKPDGDADNDADVDAVDLGIWQSQFGLPAPVVAATAPLSSEPIASAELIDAAMAIELNRGVDAEDAPTLDEDPAFAAVDADLSFAAEAIAPAGKFADDNERSDTNASVDEDAETPWLSDELLKQVFG